MSDFRLTNVAAYWTLAEGDVARTVEVIPGECMVDVDANGAVVGLEMLGSTDPGDFIFAILRLARFPA